MTELMREVIPTVDCDLVCYVRKGKSDGPWLVLYHGACGASFMWENQYDQFPGYNLVFVNVRGQGESPMKTGTPKFWDAVADVERIYTHFGLDRAILVGHSWGGNPLQEFTLAHSERVTALVISGSWGQHRVMSVGERLSLKITPIVYSIVPWTVMARFAASACSQVPQTREQVRTQILASGREVFMSLGLSAYKEVHAIDGYRGDPPMLLIRGAQDFPRALEKIYSYIEAKNPQARQHVIPNTVHQPMNDVPEEFNSVLGDFLQEVAPLSGS